MATNTTYILYDIPGTATKHQSTYGKPGMRLSLPRRTNRCTYDTCKRIVLNYKQIHHKWLNALVRRTPFCGAAASRYTQSPSRPCYGHCRCLSGSVQIALNLEHLYPHSPKLFLTNFDDTFLRSVVTALVPLLLSKIWTQLGERTGARTTSVRRASVYFAGLARHFPHLALPPPRAGLRCVRRWSRSREMRMRAVLLIHSSSVSGRRTPMSSRHVGSVGHVGCGVRIRKSGPHWKRGMVGSRLHSLNGSTWIHLHQTLPRAPFCFLFDSLC
jgi:hypothetical protein